MSVSREQVERYTKYRLERLIGMTQPSAQSGVLARLRRGVGHHPGSQPWLWGELLSEMPQEMMNNSGEPSNAEMAVYTALTLFALHQQSKDIKSECMHCEGTTLGAACGSLVADENDRDRVARRFNAMATSANLRELSNHLRGIVQLLRAKDIGLDYSALAGELYVYSFKARRNDIRLKWGQDFYREIYNNIDKNKEDENNE